MFDKLFSISYKDVYPYRKTIIKICGLKFSYKYRPKNMSPMLLNDETSQEAIKINHNLIYFVLNEVKNGGEKDLFCLRNNNVCYIFNKKILDWGIDNFKDFIFNSMWVLQKVLKFDILNSDTALYKEHIERAKENNEFLWKYNNISTTILHKFLSSDIEGNIYVNEKILYNVCIKIDKSKPHFEAKNSRRLFIEGTDLATYIYRQPRTYEEQKAVFIGLIEYIFAEYGLPDGKISNKVYDCHLSNFIIDKYGKFHFIDDEYVSDKPVEKIYIIRQLLKDCKDTRLSNEVLQYFNFPPVEVKKQEEINHLEQLRKKYFC